MDNIELSASLEDYIEALYHIIQKKKEARSKDIIERVNVSAASVTGALRVLSEKGLINYTPYDAITLSKTGLKIAENIVKKHKIIKDFLIKLLGVKEKNADEIACRLEHEIPDDIATGLNNLITFLELCPRNDALSGSITKTLSDIPTPNCSICSPNQEDKYPEQKSLASLSPGDKALILKIELPVETKEMFSFMGLTLNAPVTIEKKTENSIIITINNSYMYLKAEEAEAIKTLLLQ